MKTNVFKGRWLPISAVLFSLVILFLSCKSGQKGNDDAVKQKVIEQASDTTTSRIIKLNNTLFSIPSPYQAAIFISNQEIPYNADVLSDVHKTSQYSSTFYRAANLGVYGADLAYITLYEQSPDAMSYFSVIKLLAEKLELISAFDKKTVERIEKNINKQDSLLYILGNTYRQADEYFKDNEQEYLACLVIAGGWIESMYLLTTLSNKNNQALIERIGENKKPLDNLVQLLAPYREQNEEYKQLVGSLVDLAGVFESVKVEYHFIEAETDPDSRLTKVKSKTMVEMQPGTMAKIKKSIEAIRSFLVKN